MRGLFLLGGEERPALSSPHLGPLALHGLGTILASGLGVSQIQALQGGCMGQCWPRGNRGAARDCVKCLVVRGTGKGSCFPRRRPWGGAASSTK